MKRAVLPTRFSKAELRGMSEKEEGDAKISIPVPDILYGYQIGAFTHPMQRLMPLILGKLEGANTAHTILPFLVVEFKGDGGSMWACTNQCLGGASTCVNMGKYLNAKLYDWGLEFFNDAVFSIAINGGYASLFVAWKPRMSTKYEGPMARFYMQKVHDFSLLDMQNYLRFRRCVGKIIDWGRGKRLLEVTSLLLQIDGKMKEKEAIRQNSNQAP